MSQCKGDGAFSTIVCGLTSIAVQNFRIRKKKNVCKNNKNMNFKKKVKGRANSSKNKVTYQKCQRFMSTF